ncbi:MAG: hypothetical protein HOV81_16480 [Kofleriaceae bacterium]|nr:hypothetical protein [Kofleriaceae bacterium]
MGETVATKDEAAGVLVTEWDVARVMGTEYRYRWKVSTSGGMLTVDSQCQRFVLNSVAGPDWEACPTQPDNRSKAAKDLAEAIRNNQDVAASEHDAAPAAGAPAPAVTGASGDAREIKTGTKRLWCNITAPDVGECFLDDEKACAATVSEGAAPCEVRTAGSCFDVTKAIDGSAKTVCAASIKDCDARRKQLLGDPDYVVTSCGIYRVMKGW